MDCQFRKDKDMFNSKLSKRLKNIEKTLKTENYWFAFEDGTGFELTEMEFHKMFDDVNKGIYNKYYECLKDRLNEGFPDDGGLIYLLMAEDPKENTDLWDDDIEDKQ